MNAKRRTIDRNWLQGLTLLALLAAVSAAEAAPAFVVRSAGTVLIDKVYHLDARIDYRFSKEALRALDNGVSLVVELAIEIERNRKYVWDETVASLRQRYQLSYEALTQRYVVTNLNSGADAYYTDLGTAITALGKVDNLPILDAALLNPDETYSVRLHAGLDLESLPVPMRVVGYFSSDWDMDSEWYSWPLQ